MNKRRLAIAASVMTFASAIGLVSTGGWLISEAALQPPLLVLQVAIVSVRAIRASPVAFSSPFAVGTTGTRPPNSID